MAEKRSLENSISERFSKVRKIDLVPKSPYVSNFSWISDWEANDSLSEIITDEIIDYLWQGKYDEAKELFMFPNGGRPKYENSEGMWQSPSTWIPKEHQPNLNFEKLDAVCEQALYEQNWELFRWFLEMAHLEFDILDYFKPYKLNIPRMLNGLNERIRKIEPIELARQEDFIHRSRCIISTFLSDIANYYNCYTRVITPEIMSYVCVEGYTNILKFLIIEFKTRPHESYIDEMFLTFIERKNGQTAYYSLEKFYNLIILIGNTHLDCAELLYDLLMSFQNEKSFWASNKHINFIDSEIPPIVLRMQKSVNRIQNQKCFKDNIYIRKE